MITFVHGADFHLDAPFTALPARQAAQRRGEQRQLLARLCGLARERRADLLLLSGDLFDSGQIYGETVDALAQSLGELDAQVFIAPGNHDFWSPRSPYAGIAWPQNVHIFTEPHVETVVLPELGCAVHGSAFTGPFREDCPLDQFRTEEDGLVHLMVLHGDTAPNSRYCPVTQTAIAGSGLDYLALGHVHACTGLQRSGDTFWAYPGCPEGRGFDELGDKGVLLGTVDRNRAEVEFVPLCARRYLIQEVDVTGRDPEQALAAALPPQDSVDLCRILLTGERESDALNLAELEALAASRFYALSLRDRTRLRRSLWDRAEEDTLTGLFLRAMRRRLEETADDSQKAALEQAVRFGLAALEHREDPT